MRKVVLTSKLSALPLIKEIKVPQEIYDITIFLIFLQLLDGFFTFCGVSALGHQHEGNWILREFMPVLGLPTTLLLFKSLCIIALVFLASQANRFRMIFPVMIFFCVTYLFSAILPWARIIGIIIA